MIRDSNREIERLYRAMLREYIGERISRFGGGPWASLADAWRTSPSLEVGNRKLF